MNRTVNNDVALNPLLDPQKILRPSQDLSSTMRVADLVKPFFLAPYKEGNLWNRAYRFIDSSLYVVERYNHGLAHGLRQGALAKDIFVGLLNSPKFDLPKADALAMWAHQKWQEDPKILEKLEMASSFQRSGRQSEVSSVEDIVKYRQFELQDAANFTNAAEQGSLFSNADEIQVFAQAMLWSNPGTLPIVGDLQYLRQIFHAAHTFDLRRIPTWSMDRMKADASQQLFEETTVTPTMVQFIEAIWERSGLYLAATGDRDCALQKKHLSNRFFLQTKDPCQMVKAIHHVRFP